MSVDGFSISSIGLPKDITSAQAAATSEQAVLLGNEKVVDKIDRALNKKINNDEKEENKKNKYFNDGYAEDEEKDEEDKENQDEQSSVDKDEKISLKKAKQLKSLLIKDLENVVIKVNNKTEKIELYNKVTKKIIETITANDFLEMINRLDYNAGVLVNKSV